MNDLELVIFDCDGVLVDSEVISNEVLARALTAEGLPTTLAQARHQCQGLLLSRRFAGSLEKTRLTLGLTELRSLFPAGALFSGQLVPRGNRRSVGITMCRMGGFRI